jgi:hypothetical protein
VQLAPGEERGATAGGALPCQGWPNAHDIAQRFGCKSLFSGLGLAHARERDGGLQMIDLILKL